VSAGSRAWLRAAVVLVVVLVIDQVTKALVRGAVGYGEERKLIPGVVKLVHARNDGVAFSAFSGSAWIVIVVIGIAVLGLVVYFARHSDQKLIWLPTGLLAGGALGNIVDRVRAGEVTDFLKFPHWPPFNAADVAITLGVITLLIVVELAARRADRDAA
jgi:signal peptidase II